MEHKCIKDKEFERLWKDIEATEKSSQDVNRAVVDFNEKHLRTTFLIENIQAAQKYSEKGQMELTAALKAGFQTIEDKRKVEEDNARELKAATKDYQRKFIMGIWFVGINVMVSTLIGVFKVYIYPWLSGV